MTTRLPELPSAPTNLEELIGQLSTAGMIVVKRGIRQDNLIVSDGIAEHLAEAMMVILTLCSVAFIRDEKYRTDDNRAWAKKIEAAYEKSSGRAFEL